MSNTKGIDGLPVTDAKAPIVLHVTRNDIKGANNMKPNDCAIARAARRELHVIEARIHLSRTYLRTNNGNWTRYVTPAAARAEIIAFDRGGSFEPIALTFQPIWPTEKAGTKRKSGPRKTTGKPRATPHVVKNVRAGPA